ncbi:hypothetical protein [Thalassobacillus sp. CUG 92003]|uniref:hypothetical protein n=1 Tax=Thalassobacillus sp. CUG 92003 TaxID=2736641 RepID=UPI0015E65A91|nr:hypothetical protein [Thalassobacillus sp. CUG 92003]
MFNWFKNLERSFNPLYLPLFTVIPIEIFLLFIEGPWNAVEMTTWIIGCLFLVFSGITEMASEEMKHRLFGHIYLSSAVLFGILNFLLRDFHF